MIIPDNEKIQKQHEQKFEHRNIWKCTHKTEVIPQKRLIYYTTPNRGDGDEEKLCPDEESE